MIPLAYVVRTVVVPPAPTALTMNLPYSVEHGSFEGEMIVRALHTHPLFRGNNSTVYHMHGRSSRSNARRMEGEHGTHLLPSRQGTTNGNPN
jgi:hypothetical protein